MSTFNEDNLETIKKIENEKDIINYNIRKKNEEYWKPFYEILEKTIKYKPKEYKKFLYPFKIVDHYTSSWFDSYYTIKYGRINLVEIHFCCINNGRENSKCDYSKESFLIEFYEKMVEFLMYKKKQEYEVAVNKQINQKLIQFKEYDI